MVTREEQSMFAIPFAIRRNGRKVALIDIGEDDGGPAAIVRFFELYGSPLTLDEKVAIDGAEDGGAVLDTFVSHGRLRPGRTEAVPVFDFDAPIAANQRYLEALEFAVAAHAAVAQARKGTDFPYVIHPIRVAALLSRYGYAEHVVVAGFLHDVVEDTNQELSDVERAFGRRVASLVRAASEPNKEAPWRERKEHTIACVRDGAPRTALSLIAADKLDNARNLVESIDDRGEDLWSSFNAGALEQAWYYGSLAVALASRRSRQPLVRHAVSELASLSDCLRRGLPGFDEGFFRLNEIIRARFNARLQSQNRAEVEAARGLGRASCPDCGGSGEQLSWFWFTTPPASWAHLAGREGPMGFCDRDCREVDFVLTCMN
jgi:guanosine-3',5'-bis(diphosphate) 3'-pyrophosphohydrolase